MVRYNPDGYIPSSGRKIKEDGSVVNIADLIEKLANNGIEVTGSIAEYGWAHNQPEPTPAESFAFGVRIEADGYMTSLYWNGSVWEELTI